MKTDFWYKYTCFSFQRQTYAKEGVQIREQIRQAPEEGR